MITVYPYNLSILTSKMLEKHHYAENARMDILKEHHFYYDNVGIEAQELQQFIEKFGEPKNDTYTDYCYSVNCKDSKKHTVMALSVDGIEDDDLYLTAYPLNSDLHCIKLSRDNLANVSEITLKRGESSLFEIFESAIQTGAIECEHIIRPQSSSEDEFIHSDRDIILLDMISSNTKVSNDGSLCTPIAIFVCNLYDLKMKYTGFYSTNVSKYINDKFGYINEFSG